MNYTQFINTYLGKKTDYDGVAGVQCVDLAKVYLNKVFGIKPGSWGDAHCYYDNFTSHKELVNNFTRIANTPSFVPKKGDIVVWNSKRSSGHGHIAIATGEGNTSAFYTYDQNWDGKGGQMKKCKHDYSNVSGVLRPKDQTKINGVVINTSKYTPGSYQVTANALNVRKGPGTNYAKVTTIKKGSKQGIDRVSGDWGHLMNNAGYIHLGYCKKI